MSTIDALTEKEVRAQLAKAVERLKRIAAPQHRYYLKNKAKICEHNRDQYSKNKETLLARRRKVYDPEYRQKLYLNHKAKEAAKGGESVV